MDSETVLSAEPYFLKQNRVKKKIYILKMITHKQNIVVASIMMLTMAIMACTQSTNNSTRTIDEEPLSYDTTVADTVKFHLETQIVDGGYGYIIAVAGRKKISQTVIPVVEGRNHFLSPDDALKVGKLVLAKMASGEGLPSLTMDDLRNAGIVDHDGNLIKK